MADLELPYIDVGITQVSRRGSIGLPSDSLRNGGLTKHKRICRLIHGDLIIIHPNQQVVCTLWKILQIDVPDDKTLSSWEFMNGTWPDKNKLWQAFSEFKQMMKQ